MGARVDRVEGPTGDPARHLPPFGHGVGAYFAALNHGKRSIAVNLRSAEGIAAVLRLVPRYDVVIEGFRPGVLEAMGLGPDVLRAARADIIVARISGFGQTGPWAKRAGHDLNYVGLAGVLARESGAAPPAPPPVQVSDFSGALVAAQQICASLFARERTGHGAVLDISLAQSAMSMMGPLVAALTDEGREPSATGEALSGAVPFYDTFRCEDGRFLTVGSLEPKFQQVLMGVVGSDLGYDALAAVFATAPRDVWVERLEGACVGPALGLNELASHPHWQARQALHSVGSTSWVRPPMDVNEAQSLPAIGEHTDRILAEAGFSTQAIGDLRRVGAVH
jgi:alpha-methylacyl-CoA racemase